MEMLKVEGESFFMGLLPDNCTLGLLSGSFGLIINGSASKSEMKNRSNQAVLKFLEGYNCAQAVLFSFCDELQFDHNIALKLSCGLGAGMGRNQEVCGAITGGIIVLGMRFGRGTYEDKSSTETTYAKTSELMFRFKNRHGSYICRNLLGNCDLMTEQGQKYFKDNDLLNKTCKHCVQSVVEILEELIK